jgi:hypothetical protein
VGTNTLVPDAQSLTNYGARALVPTNILAEHPDAANDPTLQKIAALKPKWVSKVTCKVLDASMGPAKVATPTAGQVGQGANSSIQSNNWAGWMMDHPSSGATGIAGTGMQWTVPAAATNGTSENQINEADWPGIGSGAFSGDTLIQAGSEVYRDKTADGVVPWYELYPQENMVVITSLPTLNYADVHYLVDVQYDPKANTGYFTVCVNSQCASLSQKLSGSSRDSQAEWIRERPSWSGTLMPLATTAKETFTNIGGSGFVGSSTVGFTPGSTNTPTSGLYKYVMTGCNGKTLINPGTMSSTGSFSMTVSDQGVQDRC